MALADEQLQAPAADGLRLALDQPETFDPEKLELSNFSTEEQAAVAQKDEIERVVRETPTPKGERPLEKPMTWDKIQAQPEWWELSNSKRQEILGAWSTQMMDWMRTQPDFDQEKTPKLMEDFATEQRKAINVSFYDRLKNGVQQFVGGGAQIPADMLETIAITSYRFDKWLDKHGVDFLSLDRKGRVAHAKTLDDMATKQYADSIRELAKKVAPGDPRLQKDFLSTTVPNALGQAAGFIAGGIATAPEKVLPGVAGKLQLAASPAITGAMTQGAQAYEEAGKFTDDEDKKWKAFLLNLPVGATEAVPMASWLDRLNRGTGGTLKRALFNSGKEGLENAIQEVVQQGGGNAVAKQIYDENRDLFEGAGTAGGAGAVTGFIVSALTHAPAMARSRAKGAPAAPAATPSPVEELKKEAKAQDQQGTEDHLDDILSMLPSDESRSFVRKKLGEPTTQEDLGHLAAPTFYSQLERAIRDLPQEKMTVEQLRAMLPKMGVKAEEVEWTGLEDFLEGKQSVTKAELAAAVRPVQVMEVLRGADEKGSQESNERGRQIEEINTRVRSIEALFEAADYKIREDGTEVMVDRLLPHPDAPDNPAAASLQPVEFGELPKHLQEAYTQMQDLVDRRGSLMDFEDQFGDAGTTFEQYTLPGGKHYRELLLTLAANHDDTDFPSPHFAEPNILAHVRFNERTDAEGNRVLFIEEIQSDWHQRGRETGYKKVYRPEQLTIQDNDGNSAIVSAPGRADFKQVNSSGGLSDAEILKTAAREFSAESFVRGVPDAPFKKTWHELAFKRMLRWAAENGFDKVAWTTGEQQAERYDLSKQVQAIQALKRSDGLYQLNALPMGEPAKERSWIPLGVRDEKGLAEVVGKDLAKKISAQAPMTTRDYSGLDLKVGGEGMKGFYDKILLGTANKIGKRFGAKVGQTEIPLLEWLDKEKAIRSDDPNAIKMATKRELVHSLDITPAMRQSVLEQGQALFEESRSGIDQGELEQYLIENGVPSEQRPRAQNELNKILRAASSEGRAYELPGEPAAGRTGEPSRGPEAIRHFDNPEALRQAFSQSDRISALIHQFLSRKIQAFNIVGAKISGSGDFAALTEMLRNPFVEIMKVAGVDETGVVRASEVVAAGDMRSVALTPEALIRRLVEIRDKTGISRFIVSHNHPSGDPTPSGKTGDFGYTAKLLRLAADAGVRIVDHIVTNGEKYYSFRSGNLENLTQKQRGQWEGVPLSELPAMTPQNKARAIAALRQVNPDATHLLLMNGKGRLMAIHRLSEKLTRDSLMAKIRTAASMEASVFVSVDLNRMNPAELGDLRKMQVELAKKGVLLEDVSWIGNSSYWASGLLRTTKELQRYRPKPVIMREEEGDLFSRKNDELARINQEISDTLARGEKPAADLLARKGELLAELGDLTPEDGRGVPGMENGKTVPAEEAPTEPTEEQNRALFATKASTFQGESAFSKWMARLKGLFTGFKSQIPEVPILGKAADLGRRFYIGLRQLEGASARAIEDAQQQIRKVLEPLTAIKEIDTQPSLLDEQKKLQDQIAGYEAGGKEIPAELLKRRKALDEKSLENPFHAFRLAIIFRDLWFRSKLQAGVNPDGSVRPVKLPFNLSTDTVQAELVRIHAAIAKNPHRAAIEEAMRRHYALVKNIKDGLIERGFVIPEEMENPFYFPHLVLDYYTGLLDGVKITTAEDFRGYLVHLTGSEKPIEMDYLSALYKHVADVFSHNLRQDIVEEYWKPYDIKGQLQARAKSAAAREGRNAGAEEWRAFVPDGYVVQVIDPSIPLRPEFFVDRAKLAERLGVELKDGDLQKQLRELGVELKAEDLIEALKAGARETWVVPDAIGKAIDAVARDSRAQLANYRGIDPRNWIPKAMRGLSSAWKWTKLFGPFSWVRYNFNNLTTDLAKMSAGDPAFFGYIPQAAREVMQFNKTGIAPTTEFRKAMLYRALDSYARREVGIIRSTPGFEKFEKPGEKASRVLKSLMTMGSVQVSEFREQIFRYAKFLADVERLENGEAPVYMGAYWRNVEAEPNNYAKAARITRDTFVDYDDISLNGQVVRQYLQPFYSWTEGNFKAELNVLRNGLDMAHSKSRSEMGKAVGTVSARRIAGFALRMAMGYALLGMWNAIMRAKYDFDDTELSEEDRRRQYLFVGRRADGRPMIVYLSTAYGDILKWIGGNQLYRNAMDVFRGKLTLEEGASSWWNSLGPDFLNNVWQGIYPYPKMALEAFGVETFPDVTKPRGISSPIERVHRILSSMVDQDTASMLRTMVDEDYYPPDWSERLQQVILQVRTRDPEQFAYYDIEDLKKEFLIKNGGRPGADYGSRNEEMSRAARNFRTAIYRADVEGALKAYERLNKLGYTKEQFQAALRNQDPLGDLPEKDQATGRNWRKDFVDSLTPKQKAKLNRAYAYYARIAPGGRRGIKEDSRRLFPSRKSPAAFKDEFRAQDRTEEIKEMIRSSLDRRKAEDRLEAAMELRDGSL